MAIWLLLAICPTIGRWELVFRPATNDFGMYCTSGGLATRRVLGCYIQEGMSAAEVIELIGEPDSEHMLIVGHGALDADSCVSGTFHIYYHYGITISYDKGRVVRVGYDQAGRSPSCSKPVNLRRIYTLPLVPNASMPRLSAPN